MNNPLKVWTERREKRERKVASARQERRQARAKVNDTLRGYQTRREAIEEARRSGDEVTAAMKSARDNARKRLLEAREDLDEAEDALQHWKALLARAVRKVKHLAPSKRKVYSRSEWGALAPRGSLSRNAGVSKRVQHHTVYPALPASASIAQEAARMRLIQRGHFARGFTDIGYHRIMFPSGRIYEGRAEWAMGAHVLGHNTGSVGISLDGNYEVSSPTPAAVAACKRAFGTLPGSSARLYGHFELQSTACPGRHLKPKLEQIK